MKMLTDPSAPDAVDALEANLVASLASFGRVPPGELLETPEIVRYFTGIAIRVYNGVARARLAQERADEDIAATLAWFRERGVSPVWWLLPTCTPADLSARLVAHGMRHVEDIPGMIASIASSLAATPPPEVRGLTVARVRDASDAHAWTTLLEAAVSPATPERQASLSRLIDGLGLDDHSPWRHFVARIDDVPAGTASVFCAEGIAGVYIVTTETWARRRGVATAVTRAALADALERGYTVAAVQSSAMGLGLYRALGFRECCSIGIYTVAPPTGVPSHAD
jgi:ribosomal protein S18 acetylase RimI-like enzyme